MRASLLSVRIAVLPDVQPAVSKGGSPAPPRINRSIQAVKSGTESTGLAVSAMEDINQCVQSIKKLMDEIAAASVQQSEMIVSVETGILRGAAGGPVHQLLGAAAADGAVLELGGHVGDVGEQALDGDRLLHGALGQGLGPCGSAGRAGS